VTTADFLQEPVHRLDLRFGIFVTAGSDQANDCWVGPS
jgi:hypothetical protein